MTRAALSSIPEILEDLRGAASSSWSTTRIARTRATRLRRRAGHAGDRQLHDPRTRPGYLCVALTARGLRPPRAPPAGRRQHRRCAAPRWRCPWTATPAIGVGTGISASDRARTARLLADPRPRPTTWCGPATWCRSARATAACSCAPARPRARWTSCGWPGLHPAAVISEVCREDGEMARMPELEVFGARARAADLLGGADHPLPARPRAARPPAAAPEGVRRHRPRALQRDRVPERGGPAAPPGVLPRRRRAARPGRPPDRDRGADAGAHAPPRPPRRRLRRQVPPVEPAAGGVAQADPGRGPRRARLPAAEGVGGEGLAEQLQTRVYPPWHPGGDPNEPGPHRRRRRGRARRADGPARLRRRAARSCATWA